MHVSVFQLYFGSRGMSSFALHCFCCCAKIILVMFFYIYTGEQTDFNSNCGSFVSHDGFPDTYPTNIDNRWLITVQSDAVSNVLHVHTHFLFFMAQLCDNHIRSCHSKRP